MPGQTSEYNDFVQYGSDGIPESFGKKGDFFINSRTYTKSGQYNRYGYTTESGWSGTGGSGSITSNLSNAESEEVFNASNAKIEQVYVQQVNGTTWRFVLEINQNNVGDRSWFTILNGDDPSFVTKDTYHTRTLVNGHTRYEWRGGEEIKNMRNNRSTLTSANRYISNSFQSFVFLNRAPLETTEKIIVSDGGDRAELSHLVREYHLPPLQPAGHRIAITPQIMNAKVQMGSHQSHNGFLRPGDVNFGPYFTKIENCRVFGYLGHPSYFDSTLFTDGSDRMDFGDWIHGASQPVGAAGYNPATGHLSASSAWADREIRDISGFQVVLTLDYGTLIDLTGTDPVARLYYTRAGGCPRGPTAQDQYMIEFQEGEELWNARVNTTTGRYNRPNTGYAHDTFSISGTKFYEVIKAPYPYFWIMPLHDDSKLNDRFTVEYRVPMLHNQGPSYTTEDVKVRLTGFNAGSHVSHKVDSTNFPSTGETLFLETNRNINPFTGALTFQNKIEHGGNFTVDTLQDGVIPYGTSPMCAGEKVPTAGENGARYGSLQALHPYKGGETYRVQHTFDYGSNTKIISKVQGRVQNVLAKRQVLINAPTNAVSGTYYGTNSGTQLIGNEGFRPKIVWQAANWSEADAKDIRGTVVTATVTSASGGGCSFKTGPIKTDNPTTGTYDMVWDGAYFQPFEHATSWSLVLRIQIQNPANSAYYTFQGTWTGTKKPEYGALIYNPAGAIRVDHNVQPLRHVSSGNGTVNDTETTSTSTIYKPGPGTGNYTYYAGASNATYWRQYTSGGNKYLQLYYEGTLYHRVLSNGTTSDSHYVSSFPSSFSPDNGPGKGWKFVRGSSHTSEKYTIRKESTDTYYGYQFPNTFINYGETTTVADATNYCAVNNRAESMVGATSQTNSVKLISPQYGFWQGPGQLGLSTDYSINVLKIGGT